MQGSLFPQLLLPCQNLPPMLHITALTVSVMWAIHRRSQRNRLHKYIDLHYVRQK